MTLVLDSCNRCGLGSLEKIQKPAVRERYTKGRIENKSGLLLREGSEFRNFRGAKGALKNQSVLSIDSTVTFRLMAPNAMAVTVRGITPQSDTRRSVF